jgi:hypothetical protein
MKQIGAAIGVNESRVSQLHARAIQRLRKALGADSQVDALSPAILSFQTTMRKLRMARSTMTEKRGVVLPYKPASRAGTLSALRATVKPMRALAAAR